MFRSKILAVVFVATLGWSAVFAQETKPAETSPAELERLVEQLDAPEYADRQAASQRLSELGKAALPAIEKAAQGESREAATRAFDLLKKLHESREPANKTAAQETLQRLADSKSTAARRAKELLEPKPADTPNAEQPAPGIRAPRIAGGAIRLGGIALVGGPGGKRISIKNVNGVKEIEAVEENKTVKINDDPEKGIKVEITEKKDGKEETKKFEAKDADELKKNHPEAHKEYETYSKGIAAGGAMKIEIGGAGIPLPAPGAIPAPFPVPELPAADPAAAKKRTIERLDRMIKELDAHKKRLEEQKAELEKGE